jgi:hypothetical protein
VLVIQSPIHETLAMAKVSLLNVVKNFKFGAKITLTSISHSFITHLLSGEYLISFFLLISLIHSLLEHWGQCSS